MAGEKNGRKVVAENRRARHDYEIIEVVQAGVVLTGTEVKSARASTVSIAESYVSSENGELWLVNSNVPEYLAGNRFNHDPKRLRKLLVRRAQIEKMSRAVQRDGMTMVPLSMYFENGRLKIDVAVAKGRKAHDKRQAIKERDWKRDQARLLA